MLTTSTLRMGSGGELKLPIQFCGGRFFANTGFIFMISCVNIQCFARARVGSICIRPLFFFQVTSNWMIELCAFEKDRQNSFVKHGDLDFFVFGSLGMQFSRRSGHLQLCQSTSRGSTGLIFMMPALLHVEHGSRPRALDPAWRGADRKSKLKLLTPPSVAERAVSQL